MVDAHDEILLSNKEQASYNHNMDSEIGRQKKIFSFISFI